MSLHSTLITIILQRLESKPWNSSSSEAYVFAVSADKGISKLALSAPSTRQAERTTLTDGGVFAAWVRACPEHLPRHQASLSLSFQ